MSRLRQTIARRLKEAQSNAAMLTTFNDVDMGEIGRMAEAIGKPARQRRAKPNHRRAQRPKRDNLRIGFFPNPLQHNGEGQK